MSMHARGSPNMSQTVSFNDLGIDHKFMMKTNLRGSKKKTNEYILNSEYTNNTKKERTLPNECIVTFQLFCKHLQRFIGLEMGQKCM